jgi:phosphohistidine phosphatase
MERLLLVLRHGKSKWGPEFDTDFERPLAPRGKRSAKAVGEMLASHKPKVQLIVTSPATRALHTAQLVQHELGSVPVTEAEQAYAASAAELLEVVAGLPSECSCALIVGHNPGLEELVYELTADSSVLLKTCSLAEVQLRGDTWQQAVQARGALRKLTHPGDLGQ